MTYAQRALIASALLAAACAGGTAQAGNGDEKGWYVGASAGRSSLDYRNYATGAEVDESAFAFRGGYRLNRYFAIEAGYADQGDHTLVIECWQPNGCGFVPYPITIDQSFSRTEIAVLGILPIGERFELFAKLGQAQSRYDHATTPSDASDPDGANTSTETLYGIGGRWHFNPNWSMRLEWDRAELPDFRFDGFAAIDTPVDSYWLGLEYRSSQRASAAPADLAGWYAGASVGRLSARDLFYGEHDHDANAVHGGYRLGRHLAIEGRYADLGSASYLRDCPPLANPCSSFFWPHTLRQSVKRADISLLGILPLGERFELFGKIGHVQTEIHRTYRFGLVQAPQEYQDEYGSTSYGVGARWHFDARWSLRLDWEGSKDHVTDVRDEDIHGYWLGVEYRFGR